MIEYIIYEKNRYPVRTVSIDCYGSDLMLSTEDLASLLIDEDGGYTSREAKLIDEQIFFYVPGRIAEDCSDEEVVEFVRNHLDDEAFA